MQMENSPEIQLNVGKHGSMDAILVNWYVRAINSPCFKLILLVFIRVRGDVYLIQVPSYIPSRPDIIGTCHAAFQLPSAFQKNTTYAIYTRYYARLMHDKY
jgi:hypothetical protein